MNKAMACTVALSGVLIPAWLQAQEAAEAANTNSPSAVVIHRQGVPGAEDLPSSHGLPAAADERWPSDTLEPETGLTLGVGKTEQSSTVDLGALGPVAETDAGAVVEVEPRDEPFEPIEMGKVGLVGSIADEGVRAWARPGTLRDGDEIVERDALPDHEILGGVGMEVGKGWRLNLLSREIQADAQWGKSSYVGSGTRPIRVEERENHGVVLLLGIRF